MEAGFEEPGFFIGVCWAACCLGDGRQVKAQAERGLSDLKRVDHAKRLH
jgi:hypothetical protein